MWYLILITLIEIGEFHFLEHVNSGKTTWNKLWWLIKIFCIWMPRTERQIIFRININNKGPYRSRINICYKISFMITTDYVSYRIKNPYFFVLTSKRRFPKHTACKPAGTIPVRRRSSCFASTAPWFAITRRKSSSIPWPCVSLLLRLTGPWSILGNWYQVPRSFFVKVSVSGKCILNWKNLQSVFMFEVDLHAILFQWLCSRI